MLSAEGEWVSAASMYYPTREEVSDLMDTTERLMGGFDPAYDRLPSFRALIGSAIGSMGNAQSYRALSETVAMLLAREAVA